MKSSGFVSYQFSIIIIVIVLLLYINIASHALVFTVTGGDILTYILIQKGNPIPFAPPHLPRQQGSGSVLLIGSVAPIDLLRLAFPAVAPWSLRCDARERREYWSQ
jgi:hypothetical protein